jgi:predicted extracellular nuclease
MSYRRTLVWSLTALALVGCTNGPGSDKDTDAADTDVVVDTDPDVIVDTDDTDVVADTDDTDVVADTDDTDVVGDTDTGVAAATDTTIHVIRERTGGFGFGDLLHVTAVTVVEVRSAATGPRGFTVQEAGTENAALWVDVVAPYILPAEGVSVGVVGVYREFGPGPTGTGTQSQLQISGALPGTEWIQLGPSTRPSPVLISPADYHADPEPYESMRVVLSDAPRLFVTDGPYSDDSFVLTPDGALFDISVLPLFYNMHGSPPGALPNLGVGDSFSAMAGTVWYDANGYALAPTALADGAAYLAYVPPTDTDVTTDTDVIPGDTDTDTIVIPPDTSVDTDVGPLFADVEKLRAGIYTVGTIGTPNYLTFSGGVVTAVRYRSSPPATNAVAVQWPTLTATKGGLYVWLSNAQTLPAIGDVIEFTGNYVEDPTGGSWPNATLSTIRIEPSNANAGWSITGTSAVPTPVDVTISDLLLATTAEPYESMLVRITDPAGLNVTTNPNGNHEFRVQMGGSGAEIIVDDHYFDMTNAHGVTIGDTMTSLTGVVHYEGTSYKLGPTTAADAAGWVDN